MSKLFNKLSAVIKAVPKRTAAVLFGVAAVLVPVAIFAAGSTRPENLDITKSVDYITFDQYVNNAYWGNEHDFMRVGPTSIASPKDLKDVVVAQEGQEYYVYMFVHNNASSTYNLVANNVRARIANIDTAAGTTQQMRGFINADNCGAKRASGGGQTAGSPCTFWDEAGFQSADGRKFRMEYVTGSAIYLNNSGTFKLSDSVVTAGGTDGVLLGEKAMDGHIAGCTGHAGYLVIRVKPKYEPKPTNPSYDVEKKVNGAGHNVVKPGDTMTYTITAKNTGDVELTNVKINDTLPAYYQSVTETITTSNGYTGSIINGGSVNVNKLPVGGTATITISYKVKGEAAFECGKTTNFINKVTSSTDQDKTEDNTNNNQVDTDVTYACPSKTPNFDLVKTVNKTTAVPGNTLSYTLVFNNTGETDLTDVVIKDTLPTGLTYVGSSLKVSTSYVGDLFGNGIVIPKVAVGGKVTVTFEAKVDDNAVPAEKCGENKKDFVNKSTSTTKEKTDESNKSNNDAKTVVTVNKDCPPPVTPCPTNPKIDVDDPGCKPCPYDPSLNYDDPKCIPPVTPITPENPTKPTTPEVIVATGPVEAMAAIFGTGALTFGAVAYTRSRKDLLGKLLNK